MPDAARLVAAVILALVAFIVSGQVIPRMPEGTDFGYFTWVNIAIGLICGWTVMGKRAGRGITAAINNGVTGMVATVIWALLVFGAYEMFRLATRQRYDGPFDAVIGIFEEAMTYGLVLLAPNIIATLVAGALIAGLATEFAWRTWR